MCTLIDETNTQPAVGLFRKGNEPDDMRIPIEVAVCACGGENYAKVQGNNIWVKCERVVSERDIDRMVSADIEFSKERENA